MNRFLGALGVVLAFGFAFTAVAHADTISGDGRVTLGGGPAGSPSCSSFQASANGLGAISTGSDDCTVNGTPATTVAFVVPAVDTNGGLTCVSSLTNIGWTEAQSSFTLNGVLVDECTFTAPKWVSWQTLNYLWSIGDPYLGFNDHDCDLDDFVLGIPVGCDITFSTNGDAPNQLFVENSQFDVSPTGNPSSLTPFPEPGSLALMLLGVATLPFLRRRVAQQ